MPNIGRDTTYGGERSPCDGTSRSLAGAVPTWSSGGRRRSARRVSSLPEGGVCCCTVPPELESRPSCGPWPRNMPAPPTPCCAARPPSPNPICPSWPSPTSWGWSWTTCRTGCPPLSAPRWSRHSPGAASPRSSATVSRCAWPCSPRCVRSRPKGPFSSSPTTCSGSTRPAPNSSASPPGAWATPRYGCCARCGRRDRRPRARRTTAICARRRRTPARSASAR